MIAPDRATLSPDFVTRFRPTLLLADLSIELAAPADSGEVSFPVKEASNVVHALEVSPIESRKFGFAPGRALESPLEVDKRAKPKSKHFHL